MQGPGSSGPGDGHGQPAGSQQYARGVPSQSGDSALSCPLPQALRGQRNVLSDLGRFENFHVTETIFLFPALAILDEDYEILSGLPDSVLYTCGPCAGATHPRWREALSGALQGGLRQVLQGLLSSKVAGPLLLCTQVCGPG